MDNPADPMDLADRGYAISEAPSTVETTRLNEAWRALVAEIPSIPARITAGTLDVNTVIDVVCSAALRVLRNPDGRKRASGAIDDYREEWELADSTQDVYFTAAELRRLTPAVYGAGSMKYT